jgi:NAD(P)-dependent dehydrogenase (short-subunit alcohol dehydrogenase family)
MNQEFTLITGATSDIGFQICSSLEKSGHRLLMTDRDSSILNDTLAMLDYPDRHVVFPMDLSDFDMSRQALGSFFQEKSIRVSSAVFAAGIFSIKPLRMIDYSYLKKSFDVSLFSIIGITQILSSRKINSNALASIVLISSISAKNGTKGYSVYGAFKAAMLGLTKSLAVELAPNTRINSILPGGVRTRTTSFIFENEEKPNPRYLLGEGRPSDIASLVRFLLSDESRWITGQEFIVDGGFSAQ